MQARIRSIKDTYIASILNMDKLFAELQKVSTHPEEYELTQEHVKTITSEIKSKITSYGKMAIIDDLNNHPELINLVSDYIDLIDAQLHIRGK